MGILRDICSAYVNGGQEQPREIRMSDRDQRRLKEGKMSDREYRRVVKKSQKNDGIIKTLLGAAVVYGSSKIFDKDNNHAQQANHQNQYARDSYNDTYQHSYQTQKRVYPEEHEGIRYADDYRSTQLGVREADYYERSSGTEPPSYAGEDIHFERDLTSNSIHETLPHGEPSHQVQGYVKCQ